MLLRMQRPLCWRQGLEAFEHSRVLRPWFVILDPSCSPYGSELVTREISSGLWNHGDLKHPVDRPEQEIDCDGRWRGHAQSESRVSHTPPYRVPCEETAVSPAIFACRLHCRPPANSCAGPPHLRELCGSQSVTVLAGLLTESNPRWRCLSATPSCVACSLYVILHGYYT